MPTTAYLFCSYGTVQYYCEKQSFLAFVHLTVMILKKGNRGCSMFLVLPSDNLPLIDCRLVYTATFQFMEEILRLERHWLIAEISVHYHNIGGGIGGGTASTLIKTLRLGDHGYRSVS
jgi:hypothetical protein